jgi:hypothetical protein
VTRGSRGRDQNIMRRHAIVIARNVQTGRPEK